MTSGSLEQEASEPSAKAATGLQHGPTIQQSQPVRYRQIRSRPTTGSSVVVSAGEGSRDSGQAQITPRRGRRTVAASFLPAGSDPLPLLLPGYNSGPVDLTLTPTRVSLPISGQEARSLRSAVSSPGALDCVDRVDQNLAPVTRHGQYFPFRHSRGQANNQSGTEFQPSLLVFLRKRGIGFTSFYSLKIPHWSFPLEETQRHSECQHCCT